MTRWLTLCLCVAFASSAFAETLRLGTLAPRRSHWGKVFGAWAKAVHKGTDKRLTIDWDYNGAAGDEAAMVAQIRKGELDGGFLTTAGLSALHPPVQVLEAPGVAQSWGAMATAREAVRAELERGLARAGYTVLGWSTLGLVRVGSKGRAVQAPADLRGLRVAERPGDRSASVRARVMGYTGVSTSTQRVQRALRQGRLTAAVGTAQEVVAGRWAPYLDHISEPVGVRVGALVVRRDRLRRLARPAQALVARSASAAAERLSRASKAAEARAFKRLSKRLKHARWRHAHRAKWARRWAQVRAGLDRTGFPPRLLERLTARGKR